MELTELETLLKICDKKITKNVHLNREVVKNLLTNKIEKLFYKEKMRAIYYVLSPFILGLIIIIADLQFKLTTNFYIGLSLFVPIYSFFYILDVKYYLSLRRIDFTTPVLSTKKRMTELERTKVKMNRMRNISAPVIILGALLIFLPKVIFTTEFTVMLILIGIVFTASVFYTRHSIRKRYEALNKKIEELESLEN